jgi:segregation and condensation protein B
MISKRGLVEGLIFASSHAVSKKSIMEILELGAEELDAILEEIRVAFETEEHGFALALVAGGYQFRTKADLKVVMAKFYEKKPPRLTQATLEVLSVIAYKQPITRPEIEKIRGVDCTGILKTLLERELLEMRGRSDLPGHPVVYGTTPKFLEWFQINSLSDLPPLSEMEALNQGRPEMGDNLLQFMTRDDGFQAESLTDVDETLKAAGRIDPVLEFGEEAENASANHGPEAEPPSVSP